MEKRSDPAGPDDSSDWTGYSDIRNGNIPVFIFLYLRRKKVKKKLSCLAAVLSAVSLLSFAAFAQEGKGGPEGHGGPRGKSPLKQMDKDGDGRVSKEEWSDFQNKMFTNMDKNKDGYITEDEFKRGGPGGHGGPGGGK